MCVDRDIRFEHKFDREMSAYKPRLNRLTPSARFALAVRAIDWTLETLPEPLEDHAARAWIGEALTACREAARSGATGVRLPSGLDAAYDQIAEDADESGVPHFLSATFTTATVDGVTGDQLFGVFSWLYEGSLDREEIPEWTIEAEEANARCNAVIAEQKRLIESADA